MYALDVVVLTVSGGLTLSETAHHWGGRWGCGCGEGVKATIALVCEGVERLGGGDGVFGSVFVEKLLWN